MRRSIKGFGALVLVASVACPALAATGRNLIANPFLDQLSPDGAHPEGFTLTGDAACGALGDRQEGPPLRGVRLLSGRDQDGDGARAGALSCVISGITPDEGRWFRLRVRGLAQEHFEVEKEDLYLKVEFARDRGTNPLDHVKKTVFALVEQERANLADPGTNPKLGPATWRSYDLEFRTPFPEVDTLVASLGFAHGNGPAERSEFWVDEVELTRIPDPADSHPRGPSESGLRPPSPGSLVPIAGRWYYDPRGGSREAPRLFDHTNADRLYYLTDRFEAPFADNTSAWLRRGFLDRAGEMVEEDRFIPDNLVVSFTAAHLVMRSHGLPNHPTATFPDRWRALDGNPNYIQEKDSTWYIPLEPREDPRHAAMKDENNDDHALPMGPIGVAVNGVVFFNPFDHLLNEDAIWRLDRCCGHPAPNQQYHYHKYPACVKSPWSDDGRAHSPLIGFAFDGFAVYGPYEAPGVLAKDSATNPLNAFNAHVDEARGTHYHVTPGKFPHIIGGYWGFADARNRPAGPGPGRNGPGPGGGPGRGPGPFRKGAPRPPRPFPPGD